MNATQVSKALSSKKLRRSEKLPSGVRGYFRRTAGFLVRKLTDDAVEIRYIKRSFSDDDGSYFQEIVDAVEDLQLIVESVDWTSRRLVVVSQKEA